MASVWLARLHGKHGFQKLVALKTIRHEFAADPQFQQMFLDEARIASGISHQNVAQILDLGEHEGLLYLAMEWVDGDSLTRLQRGVRQRGHYFPVPFAVAILADVCAGLHAAHELRDETGRNIEVVHRDVSPSNVLVTREGIPKVIDFGIAKALGRVAEETSAGMLKGKILYMAPEQAMGKKVDRRADVWAVGATLHTLLSGAPPFPGDNEVAVLHQLMTGAQPAPLPAHVPPAVAAVLKRAMNHDVELRTPTCKTLGAELRHALRTMGAEFGASELAAFVEEHLGDAGRERHGVVQRALADAQGRAGASVAPSASGVSKRDVASAPAPAALPSSPLLQPANVQMQAPHVPPMHSSSSALAARVGPSAPSAPSGPSAGFGPSEQPMAPPAAMSSGMLPAIETFGIGAGSSSGHLASPAVTTYRNGVSYMGVGEASARAATQRKNTLSIALWLGGALAFVLGLALVGRHLNGKRGPSTPADQAAAATTSPASPPPPTPIAPATNAAVAEPVDTTAAAAAQLTQSPQTPAPPSTAASPPPAPAGTTNAASTANAASTTSTAASTASPSSTGTHTTKPSGSGKPGKPKNGDPDFGF